MKCERCSAEMEVGDEREYLGRRICEDCYMDALSPAKTCDPWAVHSAKKLGEQGNVPTEAQSQILEVLKETGGMEPSALAERVGLKPSDLEREIAALRHMEKVRGKLENGKKFILLW